MKKKLFVAVNLSMAVTRKIGEAVGRMRTAGERAGLQASWVPPQNLHLTLKFLGWGRDEVVGGIRDHLRDGLRGSRAFDLGARGVGAFPGEGDARVLWVGVKDTGGHLGRLAAEVDRLMAAIGFPAETRTFTGHITVARVKGGAGANEALAAYRETDFGNSLIRDVTLYESITKSEGSVYLPLFHLPLEGGSARTERQTRSVETEQENGSTPVAGPASEESEDANGGQRQQ